VIVLLHHPRPHRPLPHSLPVFCLFSELFQKLKPPRLRRTQETVYFLLQVRDSDRSEPEAFSCALIPHTSPVSPGTRHMPGFSASTPVGAEASKEAVPSALLFLNLSYCRAKSSGPGEVHLTLTSGGFSCSQDTELSSTFSENGQD
jgi:hypothetical protein